MAVTMDFGGTDLIVESLKVNATAPGQSGNSLSTTELVYLDGALPANTGTNKTVVTGTSGAITTPGAITILDATAVPAGGTAGSGYKFTSTANLGIFVGSGAPTLAAAQGSLYLRTDGSSTSTRLYVNSNGSTTWVAVTTAS